MIQITAGPRLAEFSWIGDESLDGYPINPRKYSFYIAFDQTGRYQPPSSFNSLHIMHPTRVLQIQPTRLLLRPVPVSYAISDTFRRWFLTLCRKRNTAVWIASQPLNQEHCKTFFKADPRFCKAHTISQRLRRLKKIPPELIPLGKSPTRCNSLIGQTCVLTCSSIQVLYSGWCISWLLQASEPELTGFINESVAIGAAIYSLGNKLVTDKTLRLTRSNPRDK